MRKILILVLSVLLIGLMAAPAAAASPGFLLKLNGEYVQTSLNVEDGVSRVPLEFIEKVVPVKTVVESGKILISMNDDVLELSLNSDQAVFNGLQQTMPAAVRMDDGGTMVPLRYVLERFGADVGWDSGKGEVLIASPLLKAGFTAGQMLGRVTQAMSEQGRYKMQADTRVTMQMTSEGETQDMIMSGQINGSIQEKPLLGYVTTSMKVESLSGTDETIPEDALNAEVVINEDGFFMTMPGVEGWIKMDLGGMDFNKLMEQCGSQDPVKSIMQMREFGALVSYGDDQVRDGRQCGVIHVSMGEKALGQYIDSTLKQTGLLGLLGESEGAADVETVIKDVFDAMKTEIDYSMVFDYETFLTLAMDANMVMDMDINIPSDAALSPDNEETAAPASSMRMKSEQKVVYRIYDYGVEFTVPDVSGAKTMSEVMGSMLGD